MALLTLASTVGVIRWSKACSVSLTTAVCPLPAPLVITARLVSQEPPYQATPQQQSDAMQSALASVAAMQQAVEASGSAMRVLVASIRSPEDMAALAAKVGVQHS